MMVSLGVLGKKRIFFRAQGYEKTRLFPFASKRFICEILSIWLKIDLEEIFRGF